MKFKSAIMALMLVLPMDTSAAICSSDAISRMDVKTGCECATNFPSTNCVACSLPSCGTPPRVITLFGKLSTCGHGCVNGNIGCGACYLWFDSLCDCIHRLENGLNTDCISSEDLTLGPPNKAIWMLLNSRTEITTTQLVPGILELHQVTDSDAGFRLGQEVLQQNKIFSRASGALALNSVATREQEQIHIHVCNNPPNSKLRNVLNTLTRTKFKILNSVPLPNFPPGSAMSCRVAPNPSLSIDMARDINNYLLSTVAKAPQSCDQYYVGAGVITDKNDYSWACVTTGTKSAEDIFCNHI
jgi:hypothetical protein